MAKAPAFQWYPKDYLVDELTIVMTLEEEGAYRRLLDYCWLEGSLPDDFRALAQMCKGVTPARMKKLWERISPCFQKKGDRWVHPRLEKERRGQEARRKAKSEAGKKGAEAKHSKGKSGSATLLPVANSSPPSASPSPSATDRETTTSANADEGEPSPDDVENPWPLLAQAVRVELRGQVDRSLTVVKQMLARGVPARDILDACRGTRKLVEAGVVSGVKPGEEISLIQLRPNEKEGAKKGWLMGDRWLWDVAIEHERSAAPSPPPPTARTNGAPMQKLRVPVPRSA